MPTALTLFQTSTNDTLVTTARQLSTTAPGSETSVTQKTGKAVNWGEHQSQGNTSAWAASASEPSPTGHGWIWDVTTLEGNQLLSGTWTFKVKAGSVSSGSQTSCTIACRAYKRSSAGVFTQIVDAQLTAQTIGSTATVYTVTGSGSTTNFASGDKLYVDVMVLIGANSSSSTTATTATFENLSTNESVATPGYQLIPVTGTGAIADAHGALSGSGTETISSSGSLSAKHATLAASGGETIVGSSAVSVRHSTFAASGGETFAGSGGVQSTGAKMSGAGSVASSGATGTGSITARHSTLSASGTEQITGSGGISKAARLSGSGSETISASGGLGAHKASLSASGAEAISGSAALTLPKVHLAGSGPMNATGSGGVTARHASLNAAGAEALSGSVVLHLPHSTIAVSGLETIAGALTWRTRQAAVAAVGSSGSVPIDEWDVSLDSKRGAAVSIDRKNPPVDLDNNQGFEGGI